MGVGTIRDESRGRLWRSRWAAIGAAVAVTFGAGGLVAVNAASSVPSSVVTIDPVRILDTRDPVNVGLNGPFASQVSQKLQITGAILVVSGTKTVVPAGATGVLLNVTVASPTADGFVSVRPGDATGAPTTSSLNFTTGTPAWANAVQVGLPTTGANAGKIDITYDAYGQSGPNTEVLIDVVGYTVANANYGGAAFKSAAPAVDLSPAVPTTLLTLGITVPTDGVVVVNGNANVVAAEGIAIDCWVNIDSPAKNSFYGVGHNAAPYDKYVDVWADNVGFNVTAGNHTLYLGCQQMNGLDSQLATIQVRSMTAVFSQNSILTP